MKGENKMSEIINNLEFSNKCWVIVLPCILMVLDIVTGYYNAWKNNEVSSSKMRDGLGKKMAEIVYITVGLLVSVAFNVNIIGTSISLYVIYMEALSLTENCDKLGFPMPEKWKSKLNNKKEN